MHDNINCSRISFTKSKMQCISIVMLLHSGYQCEQHNNPADFFLDVIIENEEAEGTHI